tara:strand:+ start:3839 stop:4972 length:1134 start_codon:yes stop_codon:yes gene_type:complete
MKKSKNIIPVNTPKIFSNEKKFVNECLNTNWVSSEGRFVRLFENNFAKFNNRKFGVAVANGTAALEIAIKSLNLKKNSEVIIPAFSIISTALCVVKANLKPVLVDCELETWNSSADKIISKINKKTSAIIITHIYGLPVNLSKIIKVAKNKKIKIIEDAAEMIGQTYNKKKCGSFGDLSTFSFYANKHITTGEGGMILTNDKYLYQKCNSLKNLSFSKSYYDRFNHDDIGWNYRMTNLQAALGCGQLKNINWIVKRKREIGNMYYEKLKKCKDIILQKKITSYAKNIYWVFGIVLSKRISSQRNKIMKKLLKKNIGTRPFFVPMNKQKIFKKMKFFKKTKMPIAEYISKSGFYIPSGLGLKNSEINYISKTLLKILT